MSPDFQKLERTWIAAVQRQDTIALEQLLDANFVCTAWSSSGELTTRSEYLADVSAAEFGCFELSVDREQVVGDTAIVHCRLQCDCIIGDHSWRASFLVTDAWVLRGTSWRALSRHASVPLGQWPSLLKQDDRQQRNRFGRLVGGGHTRAEGA